MYSVLRARVTAVGAVRERATAAPQVSECLIAAVAAAEVAAVEAEAEAKAAASAATNALHEQEAADLLLQQIQDRERASSQPLQKQRSVGGSGGARSAELPQPSRPQPSRPQPELESGVLSDGELALPSCHWFVRHMPRNCVHEIRREGHDQTYFLHIIRCVCSLIITKDDRHIFHYLLPDLRFMP